MSELYEALRNYAKGDVYPFHMPGHKRRGPAFADPFTIDITEIDGFDNLHHAEGILDRAQKRAAGLYGSEESFFLVNGSTCGILSAISACTRLGGRILLARNSHKAAYHGVFLRNLESFYLYPQKDPGYGLNCGQSPENIREMLIKVPGIQAVMITSPTYDGMVSDVAEIARVVHEFGIPLIVDEAHGAHLGFHPYFPESAVKLGADLVIQSLHKTLPSLTQTALLHVNGNLVDRRRLRKFLDIYQTSSPSYVFMASMDQCIDMMQQKAEPMFEAFAKRLEKFYQETSELSHLKVARREELEGRACYRFDPSKLILSGRSCGMDGHTLSQKLRREHHIELEMEADTYALALSSVMDEEEGFERLLNGLKEIDFEIRGRKFLAAEGCQEKCTEKISRAETVLRISEADEIKKRRVKFSESCGKISGEYLYLYPPGIPLLAPGERIGQEIVDCALRYLGQGQALMGLDDYRCEWIWVCDM